MATPVWKGNLIIGDTKIPAKLVAAARKHSSDLCQLHSSDGSPVKQILFCAAEDKPVPRAEIVKGYEYDPGHFIKIDEAELQSIAAKPGDAKLLRFLDPDDIDPLHLEASYYVIPDGDEPSYAALLFSLRRTLSVGLGSVPLYGQERTVMIRAGRNGIVLFTLFADDELRYLDEFRTNVEIARDRQVREFAALMRQSRSSNKSLIACFGNPYRDRLQALLRSKVAKIAPANANGSKLPSGTSAKVS